jgi:hypothetical protein
VREAHRCPPPPASKVEFRWVGKQLRGSMKLRDLPGGKVSSTTSGGKTGECSTRQLTGGREVVGRRRNAMDRCPFYTRAHGATMGRLRRGRAWRARAERVAGAAATGSMLRAHEGGFCLYAAVRAMLEGKANISPGGIARRVIIN